MDVGLPGGDASQSTQGKGLKFHPEFIKRRPGDIILKAGDDDLCFYFRLALLSELSTFFRDLPPPGESDTADDIAVIPLANCSSAAVRIVLLAVGSVLTFHLPDALSPEILKFDDIIGAAAVAATFDLPHVLRILWTQIEESSDTSFQAYAFAAVGNLDMDLDLLCCRTINYDMLDMSQRDRALLKRYAPAAWERLRDRQLTDTLCISRLHRNLRRERHHCVMCDRCEAEIGITVEDLTAELSGATTCGLVDDLINLWSDRYCSCGRLGRDLFHPTVDTFYKEYQVKW